MGFFKILLGGADSIREAMRISYAKHFKLAQTTSGLADESPHVIGLYGAISSRYRVSGKNVVEVQMWPELMPFLAMPQAQAVEMLAEYIVFQEMPAQANVKLLTEAINIAISGTLSEDQKALAIGAFLNHAPWCALLDHQLADELRAAAVQVFSDKSGS